MSLLLSDFSSGMVAEARENLHALREITRFAVIDARDLALIDESFNLVIANHMLYHVQDSMAALREIRRVLAPGGRLVASTIGKSHMKELRELAKGFDPRFDVVNRHAESFGLETGLDKLETVFQNVEKHLSEDRLIVTEAAPLADYIVSTGRGWRVQDEPDALLQFIENRIQAHGPIHVGKSVGVFLASKTKIE